MLIITSPHQAMYADYFHISLGPGAAWDMPQFGAPQTKLQVWSMDPALWEGAAECGLLSFKSWPVPWMAWPWSLSS